MLPWEGGVIFAWSNKKHLAVTLWLLLGLLTGCGGITVRPIDPPGLLNGWQVSIGREDQLSPRSLQTLRRLDLAELYQQDKLIAFEKLIHYAGEKAPPDHLFALAEIGFLLGKQAEQRKDDRACRYYYLSAAYAYHYIFDPLQGSPRTTAQVLPVDCFDPRFRLACELYNNSLAKCIRAGQQSGQLDPRQTLRFVAPDGQQIVLGVGHHGFAWEAQEFGPLRFCADYAVIGLENQYRNFGLGVPLIGTRLAVAPAPGQTHYPPEVTFPVTAFFRFEGTLADLHTGRAGQLQLYNPLAVQAVQVGQWTIPLETDLTTPLAYFLSRSDLDKLGYLGFLRGEKVLNKAGIYLSEPYQPGKIPVLFVHGLLSSPLTWAPMFNDLQADPALREKYQFWFYLYPTGNPYDVTAADLRRAITQLRQEFDPAHKDAAFDQMVLVGHSMGGLISRLLTVDSGDDFWHLVSQKPLDQLLVAADSRAALREVFYFKRQPEVKRVIFLGTPHQGSQLSPSALGRLGVKLIVLPSFLQNALETAMKENTQFFKAPGSDRVPTSVDLLAPNAPALRVLAAKPRPKDVPYHSIIGVIQAPPHPLRVLLRWIGEKDEPGDGVVPYHSAHLEGVESELLVDAGHMTVHHHPLAVAEVRRILLEHSFHSK